MRLQYYTYVCGSRHRRMCPESGRMWCKRLLHEQHRQLLLRLCTWLLWKRFQLFRYWCAINVIGTSNLAKAASNLCGILRPPFCVSSVPKSRHPKKDLDPFSCVCAAKPRETVWRTERLTDLATGLSVAICRISCIRCSPILLHKYFSSWSSSPDPHPSTSAASSDYWWWSGVKEGTLTQLL